MGLFKERLPRGAKTVQGISLSGFPTKKKFRDEPETHCLIVPPGGRDLCRQQEAKAGPQVSDAAPVRWTYLHPGAGSASAGFVELQAACFLVGSGG